MHIFSLYPDFSKNQTLAYNLVYREFLYRTSYFFLCWAISSIFAWIYAQEILFIYIYPLYRYSQNIIFTSVSEAFSTMLHLCICVGFACSIPFCVYLFLCFFVPSLFPEEKTFTYILCFWIFFFYIFAILFCNFFVIPELCSWFLKYGVSTNFMHISLQAKISTYVSWSGKIYIICVCILQIPNCVFFFKKYIPTYFFSINRKYTCICILLFCAIISPPDIYSEMVLFFFSMIGVEVFLWYAFLQECVYKVKKLP